MPTTIHVLDELTVNKIAAGEVIENPSSVVKELVENSIDAGSKEITVEIKGGGRQLIRVTDDGCGMNPEDALLCLERHGTSKLNHIQDIHTLLTMGFRGEAIPSIASISHFMLLTSQHDKGTLVRIEGGKILECTPSIRSTGTTVEVKSLFFNVPVRKKFQRSPSYDASEIHKILVKLSLAHPAIRFHLISNGNPVFSTPQVPNASFMDQFADRIRHTLGEEFFDALFPIEKEGVKGFIGYPFNTRPNRSEQYLFINKRCVVSHSVSHAIKEGYGTAIATGRHPVYVLHLHLPTERVDINVHPQKREVRLQEEYRLKETIINAVQKALTTDQPEFTLPEITNFHMPEIHSVSDSRYFSPGETTSVEKVFPQIRLEEEPSVPKFVFEKPAPYVPIPKVLETVGRFILVKTPEQELALIDQKAAKTRIFFEKLKSTTSQNSSQSLLIPYTINVNTLEANTLRENLPLFHSMGFDIQELGKNTFVVNGIPPFLDETKTETLILEISHEFQNQVELEKMRKLAQRAAMLSSQCSLTLYEGELLVKELIKCENADHCPFGNPTMVVLTQEHLHTLFKKK